MISSSMHCRRHQGPAEIHAEQELTVWGTERGPDSFLRAAIAPYAATRFVPAIGEPVAAANRSADRRRDHESK
jgi:hypothetical protein